MAELRRYVIGLDDASIERLERFSIMFEETPGQFIRRLLSDYDAAMYALNMASVDDKIGTQAFITLANDIVRTYVDAKE